MPKVAIVTPEKASASASPSGIAGCGRVSAYLADAKDPIHLHLARLAPGESLHIGPLAADCVAYVWEGTAAAGGTQLASGSSMIVEQGAQLELAGAGPQDAMVLIFAASSAAVHGRGGGHVHLLPADLVPRTEALPGSQGLGGGIHADGSCASCEVWLHENHFAPAEPISPQQAARGIHSHSESEVIFITRGSIRLGQKLFPAGHGRRDCGGHLLCHCAGAGGDELHQLPRRHAQRHPLRQRHGDQRDELLEGALAKAGLSGGCGLTKIEPVPIYRYSLKRNTPRSITTRSPAKVRNCAPPWVCQISVSSRSPG